MDILSFINALRETDGYIEDIFMRGSCYRFHLFLRKVYPECQPVINLKKDHIGSLYKGTVYDITGVAEPDVWDFLTAYDIEMAEAWSFRKRMALSVNECPACEEPILV